MKRIYYDVLQINILKLSNIIFYFGNKDETQGHISELVLLALVYSSIDKLMFLDSNLHKANIVILLSYALAQKLGYYLKIIWNNNQKLIDWASYSFPFPFIKWTSSPTKISNLLFFPELYPIIFEWINSGLKNHFHNVCKIWCLKEI